MSYFYRAFGFRIHSDSPISALSTAASDSFTPDLTFQTGTQPDWVTSGRQFTPRILSRLPESQHPFNPSFVLTSHGEGRCFHLAYSDGAEFFVDREVRRVWGSFQPPLTFQDLLSYFLGPVMGFLLRHKHITSLHASAVALDGHAVAFSGPGGAGKSTTAAALALRGIPVLSEDIVPLHPLGNEFLAIPGYPRINLWPESVAHLFDSPHALPQLSPTLEKFFLPLDGVRANFASQPRPLSVIYLFASRSTQSDAPRIEELRPQAALLELVQNTYMNWLIGREQRAVEFDTLSRLANIVPVRRIISHADPQTLNRLCDLLLSDARSLIAVSRPTSKSVCG